MRWILIALLALPAAAETLDAELERMTNEMLAAIAPGEVAVWNKYADDRYVYVSEANEVFTKAKLISLLADPPAITLPRETLCGYNGAYRLTDDIKLKITCTAVRAHGAQGDHAEAAQVRDVSFEPGQPRTRRIFQRNERGEITGFVDRREGHDIAWTKVEMNDTMTTSCNSPEHRQFDFWLGDWDAYDASDDKTPAAHIVITHALDGCVIREAYDDPTGLKGENFSIYDESRKVWHQTWVTNRGQLLTIEGTKRGDGLFFEGAAIANGVNTLYRVVWKPEGPGVREIAETSIDGGKTWKQWFDLRFRRRTS